jgi:hypothetical protein
MSDLQYTNNQLHNTPGKAERVEVVNALDIDLSVLEADSAAIKAELEEANLTLDSIDDVSDEIKAELVSIKAELEAIRKGTFLAANIASNQIASAYGSVAQFALNTVDNAIFALHIRNTGAAAMDFEVRKRLDSTGTITYVHASQAAVAAGTNATIPIEGVAFAGRYEVFLRSTSGTNARVESLVKS